MRALDAAELYWISAAMAELAADVAHRDIREMRWLQEDRPAPCGLMLVDGRAEGMHTEPTVTVIQIRRQHPDGHGTTDPHWHHRWVVRLHKRWQACGPGRTDHRRILIAPHIKGPAGAPLLHREHVTAWIR